MLAKDDERARVAFKGSPMKRAKLRGLKRNATAVLGNTGDATDASWLTRVRDDGETLLSEHAARTLAGLTR